MAKPDGKGKYPQDLVAIFHASFHPTQGNVVDWCLKASDDLNIDNVEFSVLPSGLHLVDQDVVYFTKEGLSGVCVFRRRKTTEQGHRGFRLSSFGILLAKSRRPRPWRHTAALKDLVTTIYSKLENAEPTESDWEPARIFFNERKVVRADLGGVGDWDGWSRELDINEADERSLNPAFHLSHLLRILGPSSLTLYKHVLGRRRILIYTLPPVEAACILCQIAADLCFAEQIDALPSDGSSSTKGLKGKSKETINVLGMVTLNDSNRLISEGQSGRGWIACTTDAIFLEKPLYYDLLIDLTTSTPSKATRPTFHASKPILPPPSRGPTHRLSTIRFAWSDIKLWNEIDRILQLDAEHSPHHGCCSPSSSDPASKSNFITAWTDAWRVYEDVCIICAGLWIGSWRGNSTMSYSTADGPENWGGVRLEGDDDLSLNGARTSYARSLGLGIEGGPGINGSGGGESSLMNLAVPPTSKVMRRSSGMSWSSGRASSMAAITSVGNGKGRVASSSTVVGRDGVDDFEDGERKDMQMLTTLALLQTFHAHTAFQLSTLESLLPKDLDTPTIIYLAPKDVVAFGLGPLSGFDAKYLEWLGQEYAGNVKVVVRRGWKDLLGAIFGYG